MFRINHAILHVFDFTSCVNIFSQAELDLESKQVKQYITNCLLYTSPSPRD